MNRRKLPTAGLFSGLNNLIDITLDPRHSAICGYKMKQFRTIPRKGMRVGRCIGIVFLLARFVLLPIINRNRDAGQAGDPAAKKRFDALHRVSVIVNMVQLLAVLAVLVRHATH